NALQYAFTWSVDGLINEYGNPCQVLKEGALTTAPPLEDCELLEIDGLTYETFNTSGGVGDLIESCQGKVQHLNYKTIRYPGHCQKMKFLMFDLKLNEDRDTLKRILMRAVPETEQDVVVVYVSVNGMRHQQFVEENRVNKFYAETMDGLVWSAIQLSTASEICTVIDLVFADAKKYRGFIHHQAFLYDDIVKNRFGKYFS
ncbi:MAG: L-lysine dehydrogenase, partial [uncultured bacterium]